MIYIAFPESSALSALCCARISTGRSERFVSCRVVGIYLAIAMSIIPFNSDMIPAIAIMGCLLAGILLYYGKTLAIDNLSNGFVVSLLVLLFILCCWML